MEILTSYHDSPVGFLRIDVTGSFVQAVTFADEKGTNTGENAWTQLCLSQLEAYFNGTRKLFELPLQQAGTPFQQKVWTLLQDIPFGKTISYHQLAKQYGDLKAIRAVASANGRNALAIIVPCHRVIGSNGTLTGYAGGLWRKQWLLQHEAKHHHGVQELFG